MNHRRLSLALFLAIAPAVGAQQRGGRDPHLGYVYPAGGQQGTTFRVQIAGQNLNNVTNAFVSGAGVRVAVVESPRIITGKEAEEFRNQMKELQSLRTGGQLPTNSVLTGLSRDEIQQRTEEIRKQLQAFEKKRMNPVLGDTAILEITIAPDAVTGERELRAVAANGLSNPLVFHVGQLPEFQKETAKPRSGFRPRSPQPQAAAATETAITLPATVNGQILPGGVDRFRFTAQRGQRLVAVVSARTLIPYLADAVPGWFQAALTLYDAAGNELSYADAYKFNPDPVIYYEIPADGEYVMEIHDSVYRGREDFIYRLTMAEMPFVTSIFPLGGPVGAKTILQVRGWNLAKTNTVLDATGQAPGCYPFSPSQGAPAANCLLFALDTLPEIFEKEPNNKPAQAQPVTLPVIVNGRIDAPGDWDVFRFDGQAGQEIVAEVVARRLCSPLDSVLKLTDDAGQQIAFNDDFEDKGAGLETHHADSYLRVTLPATGTYYLFLGDTQHHGGPDYSYRLRLSAPRPDFELRATPSSLSTRGAGSVPITVYALRKDGFTNAIAFALKNAPPGFKLTGTTAMTTQDQVKVTLLTPPPTESLEPLHLTLEGRATVRGVALVHPALPADDEMQAFVYRHLVPAQELDVAVVGRYTPRAIVRLMTTPPLKIPAGGDARLQLAHAPAKFQFELKAAPPGLTIQSVVPARDGSELMLHSDALKLKPGQTGTLVLKVVTEKTTDAATGQKQRVEFELTPVIAYEIVAP